jgi:hypothetical protein
MGEEISRLGRLQALISSVWKGGKIWAGRIIFTEAMA